MKEEKIELNGKTYVLESTIPKNVKSDVKNGFWQLNKNYLIRTVTHIQVGKLIGVDDKELFLSNASWIADTGRFQNMLEKGVESNANSEIELFKSDVIIGRGAIIDAVIYNFDLPNKQK